MREARAPRDAGPDNGEAERFARPDFISAGPPEVTLSEPRFTDECEAVYRRVVQALTDAGIPFLVGGALALNRHTGIWRDTKDLDLYVPFGALHEALGILADAGFQTGEVYRSWLAKAWKGDVFVDFIHRGANGIHPVRDAWFERATHGELFERRIAYAAAEDVILSKVFVGNRVRFDGADVLHLVHVKGRELDWNLLVDIAGAHAGLVLAYLHMYRWAYPAFAERVPEDAMAALEERARADSEAPSMPFRGSLLDIVSFRVDVEGWGYPDPHRAILEDLRDELGIPPGVTFK